MSTVSEIAMQYSAKGVQGAVRSDKRVRDSIKDTAKTARSERGEINRWMDRHKSAIQMIGLATAGVLGAILSASPTMRAELAGVRMAFSLFADTIVNDVLPNGTSLVDIAFDIEEAYRDLPGPVRRGTSALIVFGGVVAGLLLTMAAGQSIIAGTFVAQGLATVAGVATSAAGGVAAVSAATISLAVALGVGLGLLGVWALELFGIIDLARSLGSWFGDRLPAWVVDGMMVMASVVSGAALLMGAAILGFVENGVSGAVERTREMLGQFRGAWERTGDRVVETLGSAKGRVLENIDTMRDRGIESAREMGQGMADSFRAAWNDAVPESVSIPSITIAGRTYGGGSINLPRLRHGGMIESGGLAQLHAGEQVVPAAEVSSSSGGGGGGTTIINVEQTIESGGSPRRTADKSADAVSQVIQDEVSSRR